MCKRHAIHIACWNARGYLASIPYIRHLLSETDILAISEIRSMKTDLTAYLIFLILTCALPVRVSKLQLKTTVMVEDREVLPYFEIKGISVVSDIIFDRVCVIRLQTSLGGVIYILSVYLTAQRSCESIESTLDKISEVIESRDEGARVITVNFNGDVGSGGGPRGDKVLRFFDRHGLVPLNMQETASGPIDTSQWAQILPECYMNVQFWSEYSGPIMNISAMFRS